MTDLARVRLVLASGRARGGWWSWCVIVLLALAGGAAAGHFYRIENVDLQAQAAAAQEKQALQRGLEQARLQLRVAESHGQELEREIDALNRRLREAQEELSFVRKARDGGPRH